MKYGCIGEKLSHSFSAQIHGMLGNAEYELREIAPENLAAFMQERDFCAMNVTIPYKQAVMPFLDEISEDAREIGAVNTVVNRGGRLVGYNTDFGGMTMLLKKLLKEKGLSDLQGQKALVLGTGGTGKTAVHVLKALRCTEIVRVSRNGRDGAVTYEEMYRDHTDAGFIVNTTPVGMYPHVDACPVDVDRFTCLKGVLDAVYNPLRTRLVQSAREKGVRAEGGLYMLVMQAVLAAEIFFERPICREMAEEVYRKVKQDRENIVLIGMPGCGKSTVGRYLASRLEREITDTDKVVEEEQQCSIAAIFAEDGEEAFRDLETDVIRRVSVTGGKIISTGGGAVLRMENVRYLRMNGQIYFLDRDLTQIRPTRSRPLSATQEDLEKRYRERYPIYIALCDRHVKTLSAQKKTAALIEGMFLE